jgi:phosphoglycerate dehydrogenase-like enzyme
VHAGTPPPGRQAQSVWRAAQVTRAVIEAAKGRLKVVGRAGVGVDNVDLGAATEARARPQGGAGYRT